MLALFLFIKPEITIFNLDKIAYEHIRATNIMVAVWFAIFSIPTFIFVKQDKKSNEKLFNVIAKSIKHLKYT